jgi:predicted glycosyltransferase
MMRRRRVVLYSPGMVGLGHMRRNLLIAQALAEGPEPAVILLIAEGREASAFALPPGVDCLTLPALRKDADGGCRSRHLDLPLAEVVAVRAKAIRATLKAFQPDVCIVDHLPRGAIGELDAALRTVRSTGRTRCVLGLRDILGHPAAVARTWRKWRSEAAIRKHYDAIWVYGDSTVYDPVVEYSFPADFRIRTRFTGYLDHRARLQHAEKNGSDPLPGLGLPPGPLVVCVVGGGQDGGPLAEAFVQAALPHGASGIVLTGPFMSPEQRRRIYGLAAGNRRLRVLEFLSEPAILLRRAHRVVAMGGYNTIWEMLSYGVEALVVPRMGSSGEQRIRAERLEALGVVDTLTPADATPEALSRWLARKAPGRVDPRDLIDFHGFERLPRLLDEVITGRAGAGIPLAGGVA